MSVAAVRAVDMAVIVAVVVIMVIVIVVAVRTMDMGLLSH
ncbi:CHASE3 domain sensor protein [Pseudomonas sp. TE3911]